MSLCFRFRVRALTAAGLVTALAAVPATAATSPAPAATSPAPAASGAAVPSPPSVCTPRAQPARPGIRLTGAAAVSGHPGVTELTFQSTALGQAVHADVLLPAGYSAASTTRYPVLYLLHGHGGSYHDWVDHGVDGLFRGVPVIVVMPDGGYDGWYSDWYGTQVGSPAGGTPGWETFHIDELIPWIDGHYRTIDDRRGRAVAGLSMGGFGAMSYAARHPDLFVAAAAFSGAVDSDLAYPLGSIIEPVAANGADGKAPDLCIWGDPVTQDVIWRDHDPTELAGNLAGLSLFVASGNGLPGRYDSPTNPSPGAALTEAGIWQMTQAFDQALNAAGVAHVDDFYGPGTHSWGYWMDDLRTFLPQLTRAFSSPPPAPPANTFDFRSATSRFSVWGWSFSAQRDVTEFTYLRSVGRDGLVVAGTGTLTVDTPPQYQPAGRYLVGGTGGREPVAITADGAGRLHFPVGLGPSSATQQYTFDPAPPPNFTVATVTIRPA